MKDLNTVDHHPILEEMAEILSNRVQNKDKRFFRVCSAYFLAKMAGAMRAQIQTKDRGQIPVNIYAISLATSGFGKGHSVNILETDMVGAFRKRFMEETFPIITDQTLWKMAIEKAVMSGKTEEEEKEALDRDHRAAGSYVFTFDSGTPPAVKQMRQKLLLSGCGSINLQVDEIGSNLVSATDVLNVFLELYDQGLVKQKLTKNTAESKRGEDLDGKTPANIMLFGTPSKLFDGAQTEEAFFSFLETGYARRSLFAWGEKTAEDEELTAAQIYYNMIQPKNSSVVAKLSGHFAQLADPTKYGWLMEVSDDVAIELLDYRLDCDRQANLLPEHEEIRKAELKHRYDKALKLAGAYAFIDESIEITIDHLHAAMKLVEESGEAFNRLMNREKTYVKLAKYIASCGTELTHADLHEALPFYKSGNAARSEMMTLAMAWGYKQHIVIRKTFSDGIEFFSGETLQKTDLNKMMLSYSDHMAFNYVTEEAPFLDLHQLTQAPGLHWCNHSFENAHRLEQNAIPGFNMIVVDVDGTISLETVQDLMKDYTFMTYTTKRHTEDENRFRLIIPINYVLHLDHEDYKQFMNNVLDWLPFTSDTSANQRSKKWLTNDDGEYFYNEGELLDSLSFIPKTSKNEHHMQNMQKLDSLDNLERWFATRIASGNRNNQMIKYALALVDSGMGYNDVERAVFEFNGRLSNGLSEDELRHTVLVTVAKRLTSQAA